MRRGNDTPDVWRVFDRDAGVRNLDRRERHGAHRALTVGFLLLSFDQPRKIPAVRVALDVQHWLINLDLLEGQALREECENAIVDLRRP